MKSAHLLLMAVMCYASPKICAQTWKLYYDSAQLAMQKKEAKDAINYYGLAKSHLPVDSARSVTFASCCSNLGLAYFETGQYQKAEPLLLEAKSIQKEVKGIEQLDYISLCNNLGTLYRILGKLEDAETNAKEAHELNGKVFGKEHIHYASSANTLGTIYLVSHEFEKAEPLLMLSRDLKKKLKGETADYATSCNNLAILYVYMGEFNKAELFYLESKEIRGRILGKTHPEYAASCNNIGDLYITLGRYRDAEAMITEAKNIRKDVLGIKHPDFAQTCNNLARLYVDIGRYEKAEENYLVAKQTMGESMGTSHPSYGAICNNLGILYKNIGSMAKAEGLYIEGKNIREKVYGKKHPAYAQSCSNLAALYADIGKYPDAEKLYMEARDIRAQTLGKEHPDYARVCANIGNFYTTTEQYEKAEPYHLEALQIFETIYGKDHPDYAQHLNNVAVFYRDYGQYDKAEGFYTEAASLIEKSLGKDHPEYLSNCNNRAYYYWSKGDLKKAGTLYLETFDRRNDLTERVFRFTSEKEQEHYIQSIEKYNQYIYSFFLTALDPEFYDNMYDISLRTREIILTNQQQQRRLLGKEADSSVTKLFNNWVATREQLSFWYVKPLSERESQVKKLEETADEQEKSLKRYLKTFSPDNSQVGWKSVKQSLRDNEAAIEFVEVPYYNGKRWTDSTFYVALVLKKEFDNPRLFRLCEKKQLDQLLNYQSTSASQHKLARLYGNQGSDGGNTSLYQLIWKPLEESLKGVETVYYATAGYFHKISFSALRVNSKQVLSDKMKLVQLSSTAKLTDKSLNNTIERGELVAFGNILYDADSANLVKFAIKESRNTIPSKILPDNTERSGVRDFVVLPGSGTEISSIASLAKLSNIKVRLHEQLNATEESFKALSGQPGISGIHMSTHGFFYPDPRKETNSQSEDGAAGFIYSDIPLIRSGLALSGANNAWKGHAIKGIEDGILTAYEVSNMYLPSASLVVLSACETGLGDIHSSEGVYGLQRAFKMAGAEYLLMSLWKVDDKAGSEFMEVFYRNLFIRRPIEDAFYTAQSELKKKYINDPYKWGAWILVR